MTRLCKSLSSQRNYPTKKTISLHPPVISSQMCVDIVTIAWLKGSFCFRLTLYSTKQFTYSSRYNAAGLDAVTVTK